MATIQKRIQSGGAVSYRVMVRRKGHPARCATFARLEDAETWARQVEAEITRRRHAPYRHTSNHTVAELIDRHLEALRCTRPHAHPKQQQLLGWWRDQLGTCSLARLTPARIAETRQRLLAPNPGTRTKNARRSGATVNRYLAALSSACKSAVKDWHWLTENPVLHVRKAREQTRRLRYLSPDERDALLVACGASPLQELALIVTLALTTGMRRTEIRSLRWADIDLGHGLILVRSSGRGKARRVRIAPQTLALLGKHGQTRHASTGLVFPRAGARSALDFDHAFIAAARAAGISHFRFQDLRHTTGSYLAMAGATTAEIAAMLGYRTAAMAMRYASAAEQHTVEDIRRMTATFFG